jgi:hypothetical protein
MISFNMGVSSFFTKVVNLNNPEIDNAKNEKQINIIAK